MIMRMPTWLRQELPQEGARRLIVRIRELGITTVCQKAHCPNLSHCFQQGQLTFMLLGDTCSRSCRFCAVDRTCLANLPVDKDEPRRVCEMVRQLGLDYVVITSVTRDDLADGGAGIFAETLKRLHLLNPDARVEVLIPDFGGNLDCLKVVLDAQPTVVAHNLETVRGLYPEVRPQADYSRSLKILEWSRRIYPNCLTKSSIMVGLGETQRQIRQALLDLRDVGCDMVTIGQYLSPSPAHLPVKEFVLPDRFEVYKRIAYDLGFKAVASGPRVRSSYYAQRLYEECLCRM